MRPLRPAVQRVLIEGANATMLDVDFGTYPFVTSSNPSVGSVCTGLGVPPARIGEVVAIVKAYATRVGAGPFPTELLDGTGETLRAVGREFGTTTGRPRRCGWLDIPQLRWSSMINGFTVANLTKLDVLSGLPVLKIGVEYVLDGRALTSMPASLEQVYYTILASLEQVYYTILASPEQVYCTILCDRSRMLCVASHIVYCTILCD